MAQQHTERYRYRLRQARKEAAEQRLTKRAAHRRAGLQKFVDHHGVVCFRCGRGGEREWAKTGISSRGPWAICVDCVEKKSG